MTVVGGATATLPGTQLASQDDAINLMNEFGGLPKVTKIE